MNYDELLTRLHAVTADGLDGLVDVEAGLREALVAAQHTRTGHDLDLDVEAGLRAIASAPEVATPSPATHLEQAGVTPGRSELQGAVANRLMSLDSASRIALRNYPVVVAGALILEITSAVVISETLDHTLDHIRDLERALARSLDLAHDLARPHALDRDFALALAQARVGARELDLVLANVRDCARELATGFDNALLRDLGRGLSLAKARADHLVVELVRAFTGDLYHDHVHETDFDLTSDLVQDISGERDLRVVYARARDLDYARGRALDLDHARHDFTGADLSKVNLSRLSLTGIRWSATTRWPSEEWRARALLDSRDLGNGTYEIRGGTTNVFLRST